MSLVAFGVRIAAVRAIAAVMWPEVVVADSPQTPLDLLEDGKALIALYTGHDTDRLDGRDMLGAMPRVQLTIQVFLPTTVTVTVAGAPLTLSTREEGSETVLDVVERRILSAFLGQAEPWSQLLFDFVQATKRLSSSSYLVETQKVRTSAREISLECDVVHEPIPGAPAGDCWATLVALMRADTFPRSVAPLADWIAAEIAGPAALTQAERDRIDLGLSEYAAERVGITPAPPEDLDLPPGTPEAQGPDEDQVTADPAPDDGYQGIP